MRYRRLTSRYIGSLTAESRSRTEEWNHWNRGKTNILIGYPRFRPATDIYETEASIYITLELAGVEIESLDMVIYQDALVLDGQRKFSPTIEEGLYHAAEIRQGPFHLELPLPCCIDPNSVTARYERGLLFLAAHKEKIGEPL